MIEKKVKKEISMWKLQLCKMIKWSKLSSNMNLILLPNNSLKVKCLKNNETLNLKTINILFYFILLKKMIRLYSLTIGLNPFPNSLLYFWLSSLQKYFHIKESLLIKLLFCLWWRDQSLLTLHCQRKLTS